MTEKISGTRALEDQARESAGCVHCVRADE